LKIVLCGTLNRRAKFACVAVLDKGFRRIMPLINAELRRSNVPTVRIGCLQPSLMRELLSKLSLKSNACRNVFRRVRDLIEFMIVQWGPNNLPFFQ
jgi:hypothetical protein